MGPHKTDNKTIGNITEAILATDGPKWSFYDHHLTNTLCPLPFENSSQPSEGRSSLSAQSTEYSKRFQYRGSNQPHRTPWEAISRIRARIQNTPHGSEGKIFFLSRTTWSTAWTGSGTLHPWPPSR